MSKQRKLRNKLSFDEDEQEGDHPPPPPPPSSKKESSKPKKSSLLSFGDDDEAALAPAKAEKEKTKVSKFHRANISSVPAVDAAAPLRPAAGEYTAEKLAALQAATQKLPSKLKPPPAAPSIDSSATAAVAAGAVAAAAAGAGSSGPAGGIKLSGSFKQNSKQKDDRFSYSYSVTGQISSGRDAPASSRAAAAAAGAPPPPAAVAAEGEDEGDAMPLPPPPRPAGGAAAGAGKQAAAATAAGDGGSSEDGSEDDGEGFLPDKETIRLAKAKRERLRQAHLAPDYLPLGGAGRLLGAAGGPAATSAAAAGPRLGRLGGRGLRGEDGEGSGDGGGSGSDREGSGAEGSDEEQDLEERMRMAFVGQQQLQQRQRRRGAAAAGDSSKRKSSRKAAAAAAAGGLYATTVQDEHEEEEDEEMAAAEDAAAAAAGPEAQQQRQLAKAIRRNAGSSRRGGSWLAGAGAAGSGMGDRAEAVRAAGAGVMAALLEAAGRAAARQGHLDQNLARTTANLTGALEEVERVRADIKAAGDKYAAVQALKAYLADLADCLADKAPLVEEMQDSLLQAREDAAAAARQQQQDDERILFAQAEAAVTAALAVLGRGGAAAAAAAAAENAAVEAEEAAVAAVAASSGKGEPEVDEFGRGVGLMRRKELERGSSRRSGCVAALLQQLQSMRQGGSLDLEDVSLQPAVQQDGHTARPAESEAVRQYQRQRQEVLDLIPTVFADADEQYASLAAVRARLEGFKAQYPKEYATAYIGESAAALFAPFVRLELLQWEPLPMGSSTSGSSNSSDSSQLANGHQHQQQQQQQQQQPAGFDTQNWYQQLFEYGLTAAGPAAAGGADDADANLVPQLVESLVLPIALSLVARCWDPWQVTQSRAIASLVSDLFVYVPADKEDMAQLLALTTGTLESAAAAAAVPPWPAAAAAAAPVAQAVLQFRFRRAAALLQGLLGFKELMNQQLTFRLALQSLVAQQLVPCLRSSMGDLGVAVARAEAVVQPLPSAWFKEGSVPREAQSLLDVLASLARSIEAQQQKQQGGATAAAGGPAAAVGGTALASYARRVALLLVHVGLQEQAQRLGQLFPAS